MPLFKDGKTWLYGLLATTIGGFAGAASSGIGSMVIAPQTFNLGEGLVKTLQLMAACATVHAALNLFSYLAKSPLPQFAGDVTTITKTETVTVQTPSNPTSPSPAAPAEQPGKPTSGGV